MDKDQIAADIVREDNLDDSEKQTVTDLVVDSIELVKRSVGKVNEADPLFRRAVKLQVTQLYYDRTGEKGTSKALLMMFSHLQASQGGGDFGEAVQTS